MRIRSIVSNEDGFAQKFIIQTIIVVVVVIAIMSEVGPLLWYRWTTVEDAEELAEALASEFRLYHNLEQSMQTATEKLKIMGYKDNEIMQCVVEFLPANSKQKTLVRVTCVKYANTLVTRHIKQLEKFSKITVTKERDI